MKLAHCQILRCIPHNRCRIHHPASDLTVGSASIAEPAGRTITILRKTRRTLVAKPCGLTQPLEFFFVRGTNSGGFLPIADRCARIHQTKLPAAMSKGNRFWPIDLTSVLCVNWDTHYWTHEDILKCARWGNYTSQRYCAGTISDNRFWASSYLANRLERKGFWNIASDRFWCATLPPQVLVSASSHVRDEYIVRKYHEKCWATMPSVPTIPPNKAYRIEERTVVQLLGIGLADMASLDPQILRRRFEVPLKNPGKGQASAKRVSRKQGGKQNPSGDAQRRDEQRGGHSRHIDSRNAPKSCGKGSHPGVFESLSLDTCVSTNTTVVQSRVLESEKIRKGLVSICDAGVQTD